MLLEVLLHHRTALLTPWRKDRKESQLVGTQIVPDLLALYLGQEFPSSEAGQTAAYPTLPLCPGHSCFLAQLHCAKGRLYKLPRPPCALSASTLWWLVSSCVPGPPQVLKPVRFCLPSLTCCGFCLSLQRVHVTQS